MATPVFDGATEDEIKAMLALAAFLLMERKFCAMGGRGDNSIIL